MNSTKPTAAFIGAAWLALLSGISAYIIGLFNANNLSISEKGYFFTVLCFALFSAVSIQKSVRDKIENVPVSNVYYGICWAATLLTVILLALGILNTSLDIASKGFYIMSFVLSMFSAIAVQKNIRDSATHK